MSVDDYNQREDDYWYRRKKEIYARLDARVAATSREIDRQLSG